MKSPSNINSSGQNGTYEVHGHDLDMKLANGKSYNSYHFTIDHEGKVLALANQKTSITANRSKDTHEGALPRIGLTFV